MKLQSSKFSDGWQWVSQGLRIAAKQPLSFAGLLGLMLTVAMVLIMLPWLGILALLGLMPMMWLLFMLASQQAVAGERVNPWVLMGRVKQSLNQAGQMRAWLILAGLYIAANVLVMLLVSGLGGDSDALAVAMEQANTATSSGTTEASKPADTAVINDSSLLLSMGWRIMLTWPISLLFWHTPALLYWGKVSPVKAIFFSAVACWRNLAAFIAYGLGWTAVLVGLTLSMRALSALLGEGSFVQFLSVGVGLWVLSAFYASLYFSVTACFSIDQTADASATKSTNV